MERTTFEIETGKIISATGDKIAAMIEQMNKGNWRDDLGHDVRNNVQMIAMAEALRELTNFRADFFGYTNG